MNEIQFISVNGAPSFAVVPIDLWQRLCALPDAAELTHAVPDEMRDALVVGLHPLKAWRHTRRMTHHELSAASGVSRSYIALIETDKRTGTVEVFQQLGRALKVSPNALWRRDGNPPPPRPGRKKAPQDDSFVGTVSD
ncbi:helix-turn-helix domain-containing protein [Paraburkholderia caribensis]|uniref:helix-turn-helix domain-containing protein n=1 Tax=Paraburkholderia caribensis TaxID=75105 RepID=UPI00071EE1CF|nr:helix-turn-helix transcriptional regulator [Paraburkholderia caribensis]ALP68598.1 hypothetical protein AN416_38445 [Paraburkholderia caribensis]AUT57956.1 XRE family transcriptional regulator [Paraburkholderia caribensis]